MIIGSRIIFLLQFGYFKYILNGLNMYLTLVFFEYNTCNIYQF